MKFYKYAFIISISILLFMLFAPIMNYVDETKTNPDGTHPIIDKKNFFTFLTKFN